MTFYSPPSLTAACELLKSPLGLELAVGLCGICGTYSNVGIGLFICKVGIYLPQGCCKEQMRKCVNNKALPIAVDAVIVTCFIIPL